MIALVPRKNGSALGISEWIRVLSQSFLHLRTRRQPKQNEAIISILLVRRYLNVSGTDSMILRSKTIIIFTYYITIQVQQ